MQKTPAIAVYEASAGSGKTFALVRDYLSIIFKSENDFKYRNMLAITFTNKAVAEMKQRIVESLREFGQGKGLEDSALFQALKESTGLEEAFLVAKSGRILHNILQDYASFDVVTIDRFTHRIIRSFARDLNVAQNFEVELNTVEVLELAVDNLIDQAGENAFLTPILLDYAMEKIDEDRSWDISRDFYAIAKLLLSENDRKQLELLSEKTVGDFTDLKKHLQQRLLLLEQQIKKKASAWLEFIVAQGLEHGNFNGGYLPKRVIKHSEGNIDISSSAQWFQQLGDVPLYTKTQKPAIKAILDGIQGKLVEDFFSIHTLAIDHTLLLELLKKITPLSLLQAINNEVQKIKAERNLLLISDFNELINKNIANQPTPFIYERLGERYEHYFIDEFQDTSILQWQNMIPLIDSAVSSGQRVEDNPNSLIIVGDPKQAIYRWRGGYAEQLIALAKDENPFQNQDKQTIPLETNRRSYDQIINFNNGFFKSVSQVLEEPTYADLYSLGAQQKTNSRIGGHVSISFVEAETIPDAMGLYLEKVLSMIKSCISNGFTYSELCILVRKNSEGIALASFLQENEIPVISSESLLLSQSAQVRFLVDLLRYLQQPHSNMLSIKLLGYLAETKFQDVDVHSFYVEHLKLEGQTLFNALCMGGEPFCISYFKQLPFYEGVEYILRYFDLAREGGAHVQFFLDAVFDFGQKNKGGVYGFLAWWDKNADRLSISSPAQTEAIEILTVHKAKGLEFPVVIYPFAESGLYGSNDEMNWLDIPSEEFQGFETLMISQKQALMNLGAVPAAVYHVKRRQQQLDAINVLYVALTRAVEQLHIISRKTKKTDPKDEPKDFAGLLMRYLNDLGIWDGQKETFELGKKLRKSLPRVKSTQSKELILISTPKEDHNVIVITRAERLWDKNREQAIDLGNLYHDLLASIITKKDVFKIVDGAQIIGMIDDVEAAILTGKFEKLIDELTSYGFFNPWHQCINERDLCYEGSLFRPDRVEIDAQNKAYLLDYKTGNEEEGHQKQLNLYSKALEAMGLDVVKKLIVYINDPQFILEL